MIKSMTRRAVAGMEQRYEYDASYLNSVAEHSSGAAIRLGLLPLLTGYQGHVSAELWAGAALASTLDGDCGPCAQLVIDQARERGVEAQALAAALAGDWQQAGDVGLGLRFARAAIGDSDELYELQRTVRERYSEAALATLAIVSGTARAWPVIKRGLGYGKVCRALRVDDQQVNLNLASEGSASA